MWITNGTQADWMCMLANTDLDAKNNHFNKSLICVPLKEDAKRVKGVAINRKLKKMGIPSFPWERTTTSHCQSVESEGIAVQKPKKKKGKLF